MYTQRFTQKKRIHLVLSPTIVQKTQWLSHPFTHFIGFPALIRFCSLCFLVLSTAWQFTVTVFFALV